MWNWLVSALAVGATIVLYDGAPMAPRKDILWDLAAAERVTVFGASARYLAAAEQEGLAPRRTHELPALRAILSTGSPLAPHSFDYVTREIGDDIHLASISGGTDLISCFALGDPTRPVYRGEIQTRGLGMKVEILDDDGVPIIARPGELCCTMPFPSRPVRFWNDPDGSRYRAAYFEHFPGIWRHGDWAELTARGGIIIHGRSDATLNPGGVRIGTAEIYRQLEEMPEIVDSVVEITRAHSAGADVDVKPVLWWVFAEAMILVAITAAHRGITLCQALLKAQLSHRVNVLILEKALTLELTHFEDS